MNRSSTPNAYNLYSLTCRGNHGPRQLAIVDQHQLVLVFSNTRLQHLNDTGSKVFHALHGRAFSDLQVLINTIVDIP